MFDRIYLWSHLVLGFCCWNIFNHSFNLITYDWMFIFSIPGSVLEGYTILKFVHFFQVVNFLEYTCSSLLESFVFPSCLCCFSFFILILLIWVLFLVSLMNLSKSMLILTSRRTRFSFIDLCYCFVSILFISYLPLCFLLLTLGFVCFSFSSSFRCNVRLFEIFHFLRWDYTAINLIIELFLLSSVLGSPCSHCHLFLGNFFISSLIYAVTRWIFSMIVFSLYVFVFLQHFFPVIDF